MTSEARQDSSTVMTRTLAPFSFNVEKRKNSPTLNAINASAMSERKSMPSTTAAGTRSRQ